MATYLFPNSGNQIIIEEEKDNFIIKVSINNTPEITVKDSEIFIKLDTKSWPRFEKQSFLQQLENFIKAQKKYGTTNSKM